MHTFRLPTPDKLIAISAISVALILSAVVFILFFQQLPIEAGSIAIDWKKIWPQLEGGAVQYRAGYLMNPPWAALMVPLGLLPLRASWGLLAFITTLVLIVSVPRIPNRRLYWLSVALLVFSYPSLRHMIDGNFEALVIAGALLTLQGYRRRQPVVLALGILLISGKPQAAALPILVLGIYALASWRNPDLRRFWLTATLIVLAVVIPLLLWQGGEWLTAMLQIPERESIMDASIAAALHRTGFVPDWLTSLLRLMVLVVTIGLAWMTWPSLSREKMGFLLAAGLLIAPYASGNSQLAVLAVGVIPLFQKRPALGAALILMTAFPILWSDELRFNYSGYYSTVTMLVMWILLGYQFKTWVYMPR